MDTDILTPIANQWEIEVDAEIEVTARDLSNKKGGFDGKATLPGVGAAALNLGGGTEAEVSQKRVVKAHPGAALNSLIAALHRDSSVITDLESDSIEKSALAEIEGDWEVSPITDTGAMIESMISLIAKNPQLMKSTEAPPELVAGFMSPKSSPDRKVVLTRVTESDEETKVIALLDSGCLVNGCSEDDLEDDKTVLGLVETFKPEGGSYSLERYFSGGMGRALRRQMKAENLFESMGKIYGDNFSRDDLTIAGPLVVLKVVAVYP